MIKILFPGTHEWALAQEPLDMSSEEEGCELIEGSECWRDKITQDKELIDIPLNLPPGHWLENWKKEEPPRVLQPEFGPEEGPTFGEAMKKMKTDADSAKEIFLDNMLEEQWK